MFFKKKEIEESDSNAIDITEIALDKANFIYKEVRDYLDSTIDGFKSLQKKCTLLLVFVFSFFSVFVLNDNDFTEETRNYFFLLAIIYLLIASCVVLFVYSPTERSVPGNEPDNLMSQDYIDNELSMMIFKETRLYQDRIKANMKTLKNQAIILKYSMLGLTLFPFLLWGIFQLFPKLKYFEFGV